MSCSAEYAKQEELACGKAEHSESNRKADGEAEVDAIDELCFRDHPYKRTPTSIPEVAWGAIPGSANPQRADNVWLCALEGFRREPAVRKHRGQRRRRIRNKLIQEVSPYVVVGSNYLSRPVS